MIFKTSLTDPSGDLFSLIQAAAILLLIAAVADLADGTVARLIKAESEFGGQFDSLSDAVTFGVAPPIVMIKSLSGDLGRVLTFFVIIAAMIYALCGILRLVRYNVQARIKLEEKGEKKPVHFTGLPIPAAAAASLSAALILLSPSLSGMFSLSLQTRAWIMIVAFILLGYFMVSRWKFPSVKALHFRIPSFYLVFVIGVIAVLFLYGILEFFPIAFFVISWLYLLIAWTLSITRLILGKKTETLADFEPEEDGSEDF